MSLEFITTLNRKLRCGIAEGPLLRDECSKEGPQTLLAGEVFNRSIPVTGCNVYDTII